MQEELVNLYKVEQEKDSGGTTGATEGEKLAIVRDPRDKEFLGELWERLGHQGETATPSV
jgi:hypothetical protein